MTDKPSESPTKINSPAPLTIDEIVMTIEKVVAEVEYEWDEDSRYERKVLRPLQAILHRYWEAENK